MEVAGATRECAVAVAVNANVHLHVLAPDAVFVPGETEDDVLRLVPLPVPEDKDILGILQKVPRRASALVQKRCGLDDDLGLEPDTDVLDSAIAETMHNVPRAPWTNEGSIRISHRFNHKNH